ncbi:uncharacterized protein EDB91DRAFT_1315997 [Suillus paluster]|uniref:uncharacterized protein n=1 Tax=Suillus paluster TaxID=48578 RepID=UPI001B85D5FD|nr:uncharacterized protein EDB91DRAFT_1315997 [Suillus paluster]KAG1727480.1 hypothetical protein EDB91DRAFT_1315997 [Suillus paluster]
MSVPDTFGLQLAKYTNVAASAILIYDYFITLHSEVRWTWGRKWGIIRTAFTISRYVPFAGALMTSYSAVKTWGTQNCAPFNDAVDGIHFLGIFASEGLLIARVYAFSGNKKAYLIVLLSFGLAILVTAVILSAAPINLNIPGVAPPCVLERARSKALAYGLLMFFEIVLMSTTAFLRYRHYLGSGSKLMRAVYRDGLLYMFCIMMISTVNVIVIAVLPLSYSEMLNTPQIVAHSVLASRILFNLQVNNERHVFPYLPIDVFDGNAIASTRISSAVWRG